eukprot:COSAG06_NODE_67616_length_251_cov_0.993421_1_plen_28_part_01
MTLSPRSSDPNMAPGFELGGGKPLEHYP